MTSVIRRSVIFGLLLAAACFAVPASGPAPAKSERTGRFELKFIEPHALASQKESQKRFRWKEKPQDLRIEDETFQIVVPEDYREDGSYGVFVWVSPTPSGGCPKLWVESLAKRKLIWVGADNSGNDRLIDHRVRLAVEGALQIQDLYAINPERVYVGGFSGGGKVTAMCNVVYADVFRGGFSICGPIFYRHIATGLKENEFYPQGYYAPPAKMLKDAKERNRHVLLSGDNDFNLQPTRQTYELGYVKDKFRKVSLLIVPGLAHDLPDEAWFERGIEFLDTPPAAPVGRKK